MSRSWPVPAGARRAGRLPPSAVRRLVGSGVVVGLDAYGGEAAAPSTSRGLHCHRARPAPPPGHRYAPVGLDLVRQVAALTGPRGARLVAIGGITSTGPATSWRPAPTRVRHQRPVARRPAARVERTCSTGAQVTRHAGERPVFIRASVAVPGSRRARPNLWHNRRPEDEWIRICSRRSRSSSSSATLSMAPRRSQPVGVGPHAARHRRHHRDRYLRPDRHRSGQPGRTRHHDVVSGGRVGLCLRGTLLRRVRLDDPIAGSAYLPTRRSARWWPG